MPRSPIANVRRALIATSILLAVIPALPASAQDQPAAKSDRSVPAKTASSTKPAATLPNGASSINEAYGDWNVACRIDDGDKHCVFSQSQGDNKTGQRVFAIELRPPHDGATDGVLLLPFGLKLDDGVKLKIDDQNLGKGARFSTCLPQGCLVPVNFPTVATDAMKKGTSLIVTAANLSGGSEVPTFKVSLKGFTAAMNRVDNLSK
jgi:invasion protein IalB